jgi:hypothetical protein
MTKTLNQIIFFPQEIETIEESGEVAPREASSGNHR